MRAVLRMVVARMLAKEMNLGYGKDDASFGTERVAQGLIFIFAVHDYQASDRISEAS